MLASMVNVPKLKVMDINVEIALNKILGIAGHTIIKYRFSKFLSLDNLLRLFFIPPLCYRTPLSEERIILFLCLKYIIRNTLSTALKIDTSKWGALEKVVNKV